MQESSPIRVGIDMFPALFFMVPGSIAVVALTTRLGRFRWVIWVGWAITTLSCGMLLLLDLHTKYAVIAVALAFFDIGFGLVLTSINAGVEAISKVEDSAMSALIYGLMRSLGIPIGVALSGTVFQAAMSCKLSGFDLPGSIAHDSERCIYVLQPWCSMIQSALSLSGSICTTSAPCSSL